MRKLLIGMDRLTNVVCLDEPGQGNACHEYEVVDKGTQQCYATVDFQNGPVKEEGGVNGCHNEDLIAIVIDRLEGFQSGEFRCRENAIALTKLQEALHWLNHRTNERLARGVEGTHSL